MRIKRSDKSFDKGFTLMETLVVVTIVIILMSVGFVSVISYQRSLKRLELDETARELFVAAQNHLTMAKGQGILEQMTESGWQPDSSSDDTIYYYFVDGANEDALSSHTSVLYQMLPPFSIDEMIRTGGSYVIKYDPSTATVIDVFYSDGSDLSNIVFSYSDYDGLFDDYVGDENAEARLSGYSGAIIGWYGGEGLDDVETAMLVAPNVTIKNAERLSAVLDLSDGYSTMSSVSGVKIQLIMQGDTSGASRDVAEFELADFLGSTQTVVLDDITTSGMHFSELWCSSTTEDNLIPGENITLYARVYTNEELANTATSEQKSTNSLFASIKSGSATGSDATSTECMVAKVANIRHLENLDPAISGYDLTSLGDDAAYAAKQSANLVWSGDGSTSSKAFLDTISTATGVSADAVQVYYLSGSSVSSTDAGSFAPVCPTYTLNYDGQNHKIKNVQINTSQAAGLFGTIDQADSFVHDLALVDFDVTSSADAAGSLVGEVSGDGCTVSNVLAYNSSNSVDKDDSAVEGATTAGGLVGSATSMTMVESGAAMYVAATGASGVAGGLVGTADGGSISKCYAAGHLSESTASDEALAAVTYSTTDGNVRAPGTSGIAGGLVGATDTTPISYSYSTCSAFGASVAAGLVGTSSGSTIKNSYATGLVGGASGSDSVDGVSLGAFVGTNDATTFSDDYYLAVINESNDVLAISTDTEESTTSGISEADEDTETYLDFVSCASEATPYASTLATYYEDKYNFKTADELASATDGTTASATHYGDWPTPEMLAANTQGDAANAQYAISVSSSNTHYVGDTDLVLTLQVSVDGGGYSTFTGDVSWSSTSRAVGVSSTTAEATLTLNAADTATITANVGGDDVASVSITVEEST